MLMSIPPRRYCKRCRQRREVDWRNPGTLDYCPKCLRAVERQEPTQAQQEARARETSRKKKRIEEVLAWVNLFKSSRGCLRCGETDPCALDCYHIDSAAKEINVSTLIRRRPDLSVIAKELVKSTVLCASCHRKEHKPSEALGPTKASQAVQDSMLAGLLAAPPGSTQALELRRVSLVEALKNVTESLGALRTVPTKATAKQCAELEGRRRSISIALMKLDAELSARDPQLVQSASDEKVPAKSAAAEEDSLADVDLF